MCKNMKCGPVLISLFALGFLLKDLGVWAFWGITPWTALFIVASSMACKHMHKGGHCGCGCQSCETEDAPKSMPKKAKK